MNRNKKSLSLNLSKVNRTLWPVLCFCLAWSGGVAHGEFITTLTASQVVTPSDLIQYTYTLTNEPQSDYFAAIFFLDVAPDAALSSITGPAGWDITYAAGDTSISWVSSDPTTDLIPGGSVIFSFESPLEPTQRDYVISGFGDDPLIEFNLGQIASPGIRPIPEPAALVLFGLGSLGLLGYVWSQRKRASSGT